MKSNNRKDVNSFKPWRHFSALKIRPNEETKLLPHYSITDDIISYRICPRQYGFFKHRKYVPSHAIQLFYGTILHEILDRAHQHYKGLLDPNLKGKIPTDIDIENYFKEVENRLYAQGIRPPSRDLREKALRLLKKFNEIEGPTLYPRVIDTEHRLQGKRETYIAEGVIDVLTTGSGNDIPALTSSTVASSSGNIIKSTEVEIWDYKGIKRPTSERNQDLKMYKYQMLVYAAMYKLRNGVYPSRAVLYFLNELDKEDITSRPVHALYSISITPKEIDKALLEFDNTADAIRKSDEHNKWEPPSKEEVALIHKNTCAACDVRWSCVPFLSIGKARMSFP